MKVKRYNYASQYGETIDDLVQEIAAMLVDGHYVLSKQVVAFESAFAEYVGVKHAIGVNSGTDALVLSLKAAGIGAGDEVITQANTFHATVAAICLVGAKPVLVDVDETSFQMRVEQVGAAVTPKTRAIIPVHLYGYPASIQPLCWLARDQSLLVIEDAAQAHGAKLDGRRVGAIGDLGCFSFHPSKNLAAAGDGGAIVTNDDATAERIREYRALGQSGQNHHVRIGLNSKLDAIQAAVLNHKLGRLDAWNEQRRSAAAYYREQLTGLPLSFQAGESLDASVYHLFQIRTDRRDALLDHLQRSGIDAVTRYPTPIHLQPAFADHGWQPGDFPVAERLANELLCLPIRPDLTTDEMDDVVYAVRQFFDKA